MGYLIPPRGTHLQADERILPVESSPIPPRPGSGVLHQLLSGELFGERMEARWSALNSVSWMTRMASSNVTPMMTSDARISLSFTPIILASISR